MRVSSKHRTATRVGVVVLICGGAITTVEAQVDRRDVPIVSQPLYIVLSGTYSHMKTSFILPIDILLGPARGIVNLSRDLPGLDFICRNWVMSFHSTSRYRKHRFPSEIIVHAVWLYHRFGLSFREVGKLLFEQHFSLRLFRNDRQRPFQRFNVLASLQTSTATSGYCSFVNACGVITVCLHGPVN